MKGFKGKVKFVPVKYICGHEGSIKMHPDAHKELAIQRDAKKRKCPSCSHGDAMKAAFRLYEPLSDANDSRRRKVHGKDAGADE